MWVVDLVENCTPGYDREFEEISNRFLSIVISEREPIGKFYSGNKEEGYTAVHNSEGETWTEEFVHLKTAQRGLSDSYFEYNTEIDKEKYVELDGENENNKTLDFEI